MRKFKYLITTALIFLAAGMLCATASAQQTDDAIILDFATYYDGTVNGTKSAKHEKVTFDGRSAVKITPIPDCTQTKSIAIDGYSFGSVGIDLEQYRYVVYEYYYSSDTPKVFRLDADMLTNGGALTKRITAKDPKNITANKWSLAVLDFSSIKNYLNPEMDSHYLIQMHLHPYGLNNLSSLTENDIMYVSKIMFFKEKPELTYINAFLEGYEDGTFRPNNLLTRAEACAIAARVSAGDGALSGECTFTDVPEDAWYREYVGYLQSIGALELFGKKLSPDSYISKRDFARICIGAGIADKNSKADNAASFGTVPDSYDEKYISRAEAAAYINSLHGIVPTHSGLLLYTDKMFADVTAEHPFLPDIASAFLDHAVRNDGSWVYSSRDPIDIYVERIGVDEIYKTHEGDAKVSELDILESARILEIRNTNSTPPAITGKYYYVSQTGDDKNSGLSPEYPKKTIAAANALVKFGDGILLNRGETFRERITAVAGVTYSAYGEGNKPKIYGSPENGADQNKWTLVYENEDTGALIWKFYREDLLDVGTMVFNEGEGFAMKEVPSCVGADYYVRGQESLPIEERTPYDYTVELDNNLEFFHQANSVVAKSSTVGEYIDVTKSVGPLYLRCDNGNPGKVFTSIEFNTRGSNISAKNNVTVDNLCVMYTGVHGISCGTVQNLTVTNCEFGWIGGSIQGYTANGNTKRTATRLGNGVEVYGGCDGYTIDNCYVYQCYDAGVTHQYSDLSSGDCKMLNVTYSNNVITECVYSIEYFLGTDTTGKYERYGDNILFQGNLMRRAGYGFGSFRPDGHNQRHIRSSSRDNPFTNYRIINNVFDRSVQDLIYANTPYEECTPVMSGNTYIQGVGNEFYHVGTNTADMNMFAAEKIKNELGDTTGKVYFVEHIPYYVYDYEPGLKFPVTSSDRS